MPRGTAVHKCVDALKREGRSGNPYAICQAQHNQSYATGRRLDGKTKTTNKRKREARA